mmetsp:Transcript_3962/g.13895  ORF Transcript_3962/g.13895 Transcript_3962/m.13895 type:complete len:421 (-) Transcript_3962:49-1311(-)
MRAAVLEHGEAGPGPSVGRDCGGAARLLPGGARDVRHSDAELAALRQVVVEGEDDVLALIVRRERHFSVWVWELGVDGHAPREAVVERGGGVEAAGARAEELVELARGEAHDGALDERAPSEILRDERSARLPRAPEIAAHEHARGGGEVVLRGEPTARPSGVRRRLPVRQHERPGPGVDLDAVRHHLWPEIRRLLLEEHLRLCEPDAVECSREHDAPARLVPRVAAERVSLARVGHGLRVDEEQLARVDEVEHRRPDRELRNVAAPHRQLHRWLPRPRHLFAQRTAQVLRRRPFELERSLPAHDEVPQRTHGQLRNHCHVRIHNFPLILVHRILAVPPDPNGLVRARSDVVPPTVRRRAGPNVLCPQRLLVPRHLEHALARPFHRWLWQIAQHHRLRLLLLHLALRVAIQPEAPLLRKL